LLVAPRVGRLSSSMRSSTNCAVLAIYDGDCGICSSYAELIAKLWRGSLDVRPAQSCDDETLCALGVSREELANAFAVQLRSGETLSGPKAIHASLLPARALHAGLTFIERVTALAWIEERVYRFIATRRATFSKYLGLKACTLGRDR
jgi:predicted DCC family thiol-disulfide oxidoreductase YuxK